MTKHSIGLKRLKPAADFKKYRVGNIVSYDNRLFTINSIAEEFPTLDTAEFGIGVVDWRNISDVPLTYDFLLKHCGYSRSPYFAHNVQNEKLGHRFYEPSGGMFVCDKTGVTISTVSHLQNHIFFLSGEKRELPIIDLNLNAHK